MSERYRACELTRDTSVVLASDYDALASRLEEAKRVWAEIRQDVDVSWDRVLAEAHRARMDAALGHWDLPRKNR